MCHHPTSPPRSCDIAVPLSRPGGYRSTSWSEQVVDSWYAKLVNQAYLESGQPTFYGVEPTFSIFRDDGGPPITAETCFRAPDGRIVTVVRGSIYEAEKRSRGWPEISCDSGDIGIPDVVVADGPPVILAPTTPSDLPEIAEDEPVSMWDVGWSDIPLVGQVMDVLDWGVDVYQSTRPTAAPQQYYDSQVSRYYNNQAAMEARQVAAPDYSALTNTGVPRGMYIDSHGHLVHRRRRRRRLLTESDFNDLMRIATLPNKQNVSVALAKAIGRR